MSDFIEKLKGNEICSNILKSIDSSTNVNIQLTESEVWSLYETVFSVYNSFCSDKDFDGFSPNMNRYLDDLESVMKKLTW